jgi:hypothetical protein
VATTKARAITGAWALRIVVTKGFDSIIFILLTEILNLGRFETAATA